MKLSKDIKAVSGGITTDEFHAFRDCLEDVSGIILSDSKKNQITSRLSDLMSDKELGSFSELLEGMKTDALLRESIMNSITSRETSWFRDSYPFDIFREKLLPEIATGQPQKVRVWSAGCSTGEEPYSLSMAADEYMQQRPDSLPANAVRIFATDVSPAAVAKAKTGIYEKVAISRGLPLEKLQRYFQQVDGNWELVKNIKDRVTFAELNLKQEYNNLGSFDIILCRNVLTYFSAELQQDILSRLARVLNPGGYLVLGSSESVGNYSDYFDLVQWRDGAVYKLKS